MNLLSKYPYYDNQYGDKSVRRLAEKFQVDGTSTIQGFREFKDSINV